MTCALTIENVASLASGDPIEVVLAEHGLVIGRAAHVDWTLSDPRNLISSTHAEIDYVDGQYVLTDRSTNGTFVNGGARRISAPHVLRHGDLVTIGHYEIRVSLGGSPSGTGPEGSSCAGASPDGGIDWLAPAGIGSQPIDAGRFGREAPRPLFQSGDDPLLGSFSPPSPQPAAGDPFGAGPAAAAPDPFGLGAQRPPAPSPAFLPLQSAAGAAPLAAPAADPFGLGTAATPPTPAPVRAGDANPWARLHAFDAIDFSPAGSVAPAPPATMSQQHVVAGSDDGFQRFLSAAGLNPRDVDGLPSGDVLEAAGGLLRQAAQGLIRLLDARTRVRHQLGVSAQLTSFQAKGNNPLKWMRSAEQALRQMVGKADAGYLPGPQAVQAAFEDLQAHEVAMLGAMQEALAATVQRFSPDAIKERAQVRVGLLPGAREAALWRAFETEYRALAHESQAAFLDMFARHFRTAYERNIRKD